MKGLAGPAGLHPTLTNLRLIAIGLSCVNQVIAIIERKGHRLDTFVIF
jgi:hypothetical protein